MVAEQAFPKANVRNGWKADIRSPAGWGRFKEAAGSGDGKI